MNRANEAVAYFDPVVLPKDINGRHLVHFEATPGG